MPKLIPCILTHATPALLSLLKPYTNVGKHLSICVQIVLAFQVFAQYRSCFLLPRRYKHQTEIFLQLEVADKTQSVRTAVDFSAIAVLYSAGPVVKTLMAVRYRMQMPQEMEPFFRAS